MPDRFDPAVPHSRPVFEVGHIIRIDEVSVLHTHPQPSEVEILHVFDHRYIQPARPENIDMKVVITFKVKNLTTAFFELGDLIHQQAVVICKGLAVRQPEVEDIP